MLKLKDGRLRKFRNLSVSVFQDFSFLD